MGLRGRRSERPVTLWLRAWREGCGLKAEYVARRCKVATHTIYDWEHSVNGPPMCILPILAREYGCTIDDLYHPPKEADE